MDRLPPEIEVEDQWPESLRYRLPRRALGSVYWVALALVAIGFLSMAWLVAAIGSMVLGWKLPIPTLLLFLGFPAGVVTSGGLLPIWWGLSILWGHRELIIRGEQLYSYECVGFSRWGKSWLISNISALRTSRVIPLQESSAEWMSAWDVLVLYTTTGQRHVLVWGYSHELLEPLAAALAANCARALPEKNRPTIEVTSDYAAAAALAAEEARVPLQDSALDDDALADEDAGLEEEYDEPLSQPTNSRIEVEHFDDGLNVRIPPAGLWRGSGGLFLFSLLWNAVVSFIGLAVMLAAVGALPNNNPPNNDLWGVLGGFSLFGLIGAGMFCVALNMGLRRAAIAIAGDALMVIQTGPFGTKRKEWPLNEVREISAGPSGMKVNNQDVLELQIYDQQATKYGLLAGRDHAELVWLASLLEATLRKVTIAEAE